MWKGEAATRDGEKSEKRDDDGACGRAREREKDGERREEEEEKEEQEEDEERAVKDVVRDHCIATADSVEDPEIPQRYAADAKRCAVSTL